MKKTLFSLFTLSLLLTPVVFAQGVQTLTSPAASEDPTQSSFRIVVCDGPDNPAINKPVPLYDNNGKPTGQTRPYVVCNFNGAMLTVQHLINIAMVLGVFAAIVLFTYAGYLMLKGTDSDRNKAKDIFPKILWGFVIMLSAWFIVYQILSWLTGNSAFTKLLGNP
ncbi:MAG TPA: hypothetical protein VL335_01135 [Candidatus Paceibacterota bacterium]|jgi:hypothetical protein|nr:hypothetical protein [Candidatus Paceibacterota bacterium]